MKIPDKLKLILQTSGLTQQKLADKLGVSFAALNRWINNKAEPRKGMRQKIEELYREYGGIQEEYDDVLSAKKEIIMNRAAKQKDVNAAIAKNPDIFDQFVLSLTYNTNRIEGSSLSEDETAAVIFDNISLPNKSLTEQMEAKNHQTALVFLFDFLKNKKAKLDEKLILKLHAMLMNGIRQDAGQYRRHGVRIVGANVVTANHLKIPQLMKKLVLAINKKEKDIIAQTAKIHAQFEQIHPFSDGNGRVGRLIMTAMLLQRNIAPAVILQKHKRKYLSYLNKAQTKDDFHSLIDFLCDSIIIGFKILERR